MNHRAYAQALVRLEKREGVSAKTLVEKLVAHLASSGRTKLLPKIHRELVTLQAKAAMREPQLEVASEHEKTHALAAAEKAGIAVKTARVNHALIRGWRARSNGVLVDASAKRALVELYRNITK